MNIAILLRYMDQKQGGHWDHIYHMQHDYEQMSILTTAGKLTDSPRALRL